MTVSERRSAIPDLPTCLHHRGLVIAWCVEDTGSRWPWVLVSDQADHEQTGCCCSGCAPHEQPGPLPPAIRRRLARASGSATS